MWTTVFWLGLSFAFLIMTILSAYTRWKMPRLFEEAEKAAYFQGADIEKLKPIFNHMLTLETLAFFLTAVAAFVDYFASS